jgi:putative ABC transport system permease protein
VVVSTSLSDPMSLVATVQEAANDVDPSIPITIESLETVLSDELVRHRLGLILMSLFAAVSLTLAGIGIYGVVGHGTSQRWGEFAVRMAVGASPSSIIKLVITQGGTLWVVGTLVGVGTAYLAGRLSASWLYEVRASDPLILISAVSAVLALTLVAFLLPAFRGSRIQPAEVLRAD